MRRASVFSAAGSNASWGIVWVLASQALGCAPAYVGPGQFSQPPARLTPLPQQQLMLPPTTSTPSSSLNQVPNVPAREIFQSPKIVPSAQYHTVREGETLARIAQQYGVTVDRFMKSNAWTQAPQLKPGDMILLP